MLTGAHGPTVKRDDGVVRGAPKQAAPPIAALCPNV